jgi:hypothetical protein
MSKDLLNSLLEEIQSGADIDDKLASLSEEQIDALFKESQPFKALGTASTNKIVLGSVSNLREKYLKKLITTTMVSFLFQMKNEFTTDETHLATPVKKDDFFEQRQVGSLPDNFTTDQLHNRFLLEMYQKAVPNGKAMNYPEMELALTEDQLMDVSKQTKVEYDRLVGKEMVLNSGKYDEAVQSAIDAQSEKERLVVNRFLEWLFKFDIDKHVEEGGNVIDNDPERKDISMRNEDVYKNIPPNDTHCRFNTYYDVNYEKMREATHNIYNVKPDLEHAMIVYDVKDTKEEVDAFIHKYGSSSKYDIVSFPLNRWTLMGSFKENRERVDYYNKHNSIIKSMLEQQEKDAALGEDLMKKRIKSKKVQAEKVFGKDSPGFDAYRKLSPSELEDKYNAKVENLADGNVKLTRQVVVDASTGQELELDEDGVPTNALEVPITTINARTGQASQTRIFTRSED